MGPGCGHDVAPGDRFCGTCGRDTWAAGEPDAATGALSTPWPALRRSGRPVSIDKTPTVTMGVTSSFPPPVPPPAAPPPVPPSPVPPSPPPPAAPPPRPSAVDRRTPLILGVLVLVLVGAVLALSFKILSSSDGPEDTRSAGSATDPTETRPATSAPSTSPTPPSASTEAPAPSATVPPSTSPPTSAPSPRPPVTTGPPLFADELVDVLHGYIAALDVADIDLAYSYVSVELAQQDGWDLDSFTTFWTSSVVGAAVVSIDDVSAAAGTVTATVDYALPDGATSRESIVATFASAGDGGFLVLVDYEVLDSERI